MADSILVADVGGTNVRFALADVVNGRITLHESRNLRVEDFETVSDAADAYLETVNVRPKRACMAMAGPVHNDRVTFPNSPWSLHAEEIAKALALEQVMFVNDFYAAASGVAYMHDDVFVTVKKGRSDPSLPRLVMGPGTGLGHALIVPAPSGRRIIATEGGHVTFAPHTVLDYEVTKFIAKEYPRVSAERLLSGHGLVNIHRALCHIEGVTPSHLRAKEITAAALNGTDPIALRTVNVFCEVLGHVAGDAVLATGARGGVVLGGGILPKIGKMLLESACIDRFLDKGRMRDYISEVPISLIVDDGIALYGAAAALERLGL